MTARNEAPLRAALESQLDAVVQRHGLVLWTDPARSFVDFVSSLGARPYPVVRFEGSWLAVMLALDEHTQGIERPMLVLYVPGLEREQVNVTPALEVAESSYRFAPTLGQLVRDTAAGVIAPSRVEELLAQESLALDQAERWFVGERDARGAQRRDAFARLSLDALLDELLARSARRGDRGATRVLDLSWDTVDDVDALEQYLHDRLGLSRAFRVEVCDYAASRVGPAVTPEQLRDALCDDLVTWVLAVEYVFDLRANSEGNKRPMRAELREIESLHERLASECVALCAHLRKHHEARYPALADHAESRLSAELNAMTAEDLGRVDTFAIENKRVLEAAVKALCEKRWEAARDRARDRLSGDSIWLRLDQLRKWEWLLVLAAAEFGETMGRVGMPPKASVVRTGETLADLVAWYESTGFEVDLRHRHFEQERAANLDPRFAHFADLQSVVGLLRQQYRAWVDAHAERWTECCEARGYLAPSELQQRRFYEQVVQPVVEEGARVALFLVDALRYEMARDLSDMLRRETGTSVTLRARVAELPTITAVGMNCVVPVTRGDRLVVARDFEGFRTGELTVSRPEHRADAAGRRSLGKKALLLDLGTVLSDSAEKLANRVKTNKLVLVQTREIDDAGEAGVGVRAFQGTLQDLLAAYRLLEAAGVQRFVFVSDHGFLLQDECTKVLGFGKKTEPSARYVLDSRERVEDNLVAVAPSSLGYDGLEGKSLLFRRDTAVFATGLSGAPFVHGGNSPQERIIPVLEARTNRKKKSADKPKYELEAKLLPDVLGLHRLQFIVRPSAYTQRSIEDSDTVAVGVRAKSSSARVALRDVTRGRMLNGQVLVELSVREGEQGWTEVFFSLESESEGHAQVEVFLADVVSDELSVVIPAWFETFKIAPRRPTDSTPAMSAVSDPTTATAVTAAPASKSKGEGAASASEYGWLDAIPDEGARRVLQRLAQYRMVTEREATDILGSPRAMRRFGVQLEEWVEKKLVPFRIRVDSGADGKRYTKEGDR